MVNLFADMGVQPGTLAIGLITGPAFDRPYRADLHHQPDRHRSTPATLVTISGTASDVGGGVIAGVEVSTDNGAELASGNRRRELDL